MNQGYLDKKRRQQWRSMGEKLRRAMKEITDKQVGTLYDAVLAEGSRRFGPSNFERYLFGRSNMELTFKWESIEKFWSDRADETSLVEQIASHYVDACESEVRADAELAPKGYLK